MADELRSRRGISALEALTLIFIVLKLCDVIAWSWWWVLSPVWITATVVFLFVGIYFLLKP